ncbi:MAG TPA: SurA N-terminal domain-containing protein, partial [Gemmatimonadaceae bacterium]|nr:SurA N-terminal domain-containing protein [Gemmatimonadaceae bacterium]
MRRALLFLVAAGALPLQLGAQGGPAYAPRPLDRVVAVVGSKAILWSEVLEVIQQRRAQGLQIPEDSAGQIQLARQVLNELVDEEVLVQKAEQDTSITVADADLRETVEAQLRQTRG